MLLSGVLFVLFLDGCWLYCLADAALTPASEYRRLPKTAWLIIIIATFIVGAIAWLIARRAWRTKSWAATQLNRGTSPAGRDTGLTWYMNGTAADAAVARHPAGRSRQADPDGTVMDGQAAPGGWIVPKGPDDDPEFLRLLDRRIHGTSADPGE